MGILSELVLARPDEARAVGLSNLPYEHFETLDASGENELTLGVLYETLGGPDDADFELLFEADAEGPWVHALPEGLISALAGLEDDRLDAVLAAWNAHPEIAAMNGPSPQPPDPRPAAGPAAATHCNARLLPPRPERGQNPAALAEFVIPAMSWL